MSMRKFFLFYASLCAMVLLISASPVRAQTTAWVAANGSGASCFEVAPCATFAAAIATGANQINCLGSGIYGGVGTIVITQSITIDCGAGNVGVVAAFGSAAITINSANPVTIVLRHLSLSGLNGTRGIDASNFSTGTLVIEDCTIQGFAYGVDFEPLFGRGLLQVSNSQVLNNATGISVKPGTGLIASVTLNRVELVGNSNVGLTLTGTGVIAGTMRDSVIAASTDGVFADASQVYFSIDGSNIAANLQFGVFTSSVGTVVGVGTSTFAGNGTGVQANLGSLVSFGNNQMIANGSDGNFTSTKALK
jgi:hypothetical protein